MSDTQDAERTPAVSDGKKSCDGGGTVLVHPLAILSIVMGLAAFMFAHDDANMGKVPWLAALGFVAGLKVLLCGKPGHKLATAGVIMNTLAACAWWIQEAHALGLLPDHL